MFYYSTNNYNIKNQHAHFVSIILSTIVLVMLYEIFLFVGEISIAIFVILALTSLI